MSGFTLGLKVILNIGEDEYLRKLGGPSGALILVQHQADMPHPEDEGYLAEPGKLISFGVRRVSTMFNTIKSLDTISYQELT